MHFVAACWKTSDPVGRHPTTERLADLAQRPPVGYHANHVELAGFSVVMLGCDVLEREGTQIGVYPLHAPAQHGMRHLAQNPGARLDVLPPFVGVNLDMAEHRLTIWNDYAGVGRVFFAETAVATVVASRISLIQWLAGGFTSLDAEAAAQYGAIGWVMGARTPFHGVHQLDANSEIRVQSRAGGTSAVSVEKHPVHLQPSRTTAACEGVLDRLLSVVEAIEPPTPGGLVLGLSGGRDSRLVASLLSKAGVSFSAFTTDNYPAETAVARDVLRIIDPAATLTVRRRGELKDPDELATSAAALVAAYEGMYEAAYVGSVTPRPELLPKRAAKPTLGGAGGELAHGHYYSPLALKVLRGLTTADALSHLARRIQSLGAFSTSGAKSVQRELAALADEASDHGFHGMKLMDWFYLRERLRRWSGLGAQHKWVIAPLASHAFAQSALGQPPESSFNSELHRTLITRLYPALGGLSFFKASPGMSRSTWRPRLRVPAPLRAGLAGSELVRESMSQQRLQLALSRLDADVAAPADDLVVKRALWLLSLEDYARKVPGLPVLPTSSPQERDAAPATL